MFNLEKAIASWRRQFRYNRAFLKRDADELERHIRDEVAYLVKQGRSEQAAFDEAIREMGGLVEAEPEYRKVYWNKLKYHHTVGRELRWRGAMLTNYFKLAYRNLIKNKVASIINIFGLSIAVGCCVVVYLFLQIYLTMDSAHVNGAHIFLVEHTVERDNTVQTWGTSPAPMGPALASEFPQIERVVRVNRVGAVVQYKDQMFDEGVTFADDGFFDMFTFPLAAGTPDGSTDPNAVIISDAMALKYFGEENPMGRQITIWFGNDYRAAFTVRGIAEAFPENAGFQFSFLINYDPANRLSSRFKVSQERTLNLNPTPARRPPKTASTKIHHAQKQ